MKNQFFLFLLKALVLMSCNADNSDNSLNRCNLTPLAGPCEAAIPKYYFDRLKGTCKEFMWGGCDGVVPFHTLAECCECASSACTEIVDEEHQDSQEPLATILFVGNSLTYSNNLPELVSAYGKTKGVLIKSEMLANGNYALEDHWSDGNLQNLIASKRFDYVVVQQGPSSQADGRISLLEYGAKIKEICTQNGAQLAFFMVWPAKVNYHTFEGVIANHTNAATLTQSILCPVGLEWKKYFNMTGDYSYYGQDNFHPSLKGSRVAAEIIYNTLF